MSFHNFSSPFWASVCLISIDPCSRPTSSAVYGLSTLIHRKSFSHSFLIFSIRVFRSIKHLSLKQMVWIFLIHHLIFLSTTHIEIGSSFLIHFPYCYTTINNILHCYITTHVKKLLFSF